MQKFHFYTFDNLVFIGSAMGKDWMEARKLVALETGVDEKDLTPQDWLGLSACEPTYDMKEEYRAVSAEFMMCRDN